MFALLVLASPFVTAGLTGRESTGPGVDTTSTAPPVLVVSHQPSGPVNVNAGLYRGHTAAYWAAVVRHRTRQLAASRAMTHRLIVRKWQPTVMYALRLASAVSGVPVGELAPVAHCESTYNPFARNGKYKGLFQLGWVPFGIFSPYDPVANALSAALTVKHDGSWRRWECKP